MLIGINLLREGIDLPEVSFIGILDADKIGFLRSTTSLVQIVGRAARNANGSVVMYADRISDAMKETIEETTRRRSIQQAYNDEHGITPKTILNPADRKKLIKKLEAQMAEYADMLLFEEAAVVRDKIEEIKRLGTF